MFSADHQYVSEPCMVLSRAEGLQELSEQPFHFGQADVEDHYGLQFPGLTLKPEARPGLKWKFGRWPRYTYSEGSFEELPNLKLTIQWMIHEDTVLQECLLENSGNDDIPLDVDFCKSMRIRDLDHLDWDYEFNEEGGSNHEIRPGPKGYSCVFIHKLDDDHHSEDTPHTASNRLRRSDTAASEDLRIREERVAQPAPYASEAVHDDAFVGSSVRSSRQEDRSGPCGPPHEEILSKHPDSSTRSSLEEVPAPEEKPQDHEAQSKNSHDISVISSVAIDGQVQLFEYTSSLEYTYSPQKWPLILKGRQTVGHGGQPGTHKVTTAYEMRILDNPRPDWHGHVIPLHKMNISQFLLNQQPNHPFPLCVPTTRQATSPDHKEGDESTRPQMQFFPMEPAVGIPGSLPPLQTAEPPHAHLGFAVRRNLEHILSVCTIRATPKACGTTVASLPQQLHSVDAVAFTCGDMSGHRICWSASLYVFIPLITKLE